MTFIVVTCGDCDYNFAVEKKNAEFYESLDSKISSFHCPSCANQLWEHDTTFLGEVEFQA
jgi:predicted nucleic-acid-binding Zn-ribbon protein